jgi:6-carboxyhexanoate--CoA ligase
MDHCLFYSIRMRATANNKHVSGAERIVSSEMIEDTLQSLVSRARGKKFTPEQIVIKIENLGTAPIRPLTALDVITVNALDITTGRAVASRILQSLDISELAAMAAIKHLCSGAAPSGWNMRGAMIIDAQNGKRLEPDQERGVRASRFDWTDEALESITRKLAKIGLTHYRTHEALALATKVAHAPGIVAELCWSDEPEYTAGYVASRKTGYVRFSNLKLLGDSRGGRAFFVNRNDLDLCRFINYLQTEIVFITDSGECKPAIEPNDYFYGAQ